MAGSSQAHQKATDGVINVIYDPREMNNNGPSAEQRIRDGDSLHDVLGVVSEDTPLESIMDTICVWLEVHDLPVPDRVDVVLEHMRPTIPHHIDDDAIITAVEESCIRRQRAMFLTKSGEPRYFGSSEGIADGLPRYELIEEIGRGAQSVVWKAIDRKHDTTGSDMLVALKIFSKEVKDAHLFVTQIHHENIASMIDADEWQGKSYISFELIRGVPLNDWVAENNPTDDEILSILIGIARGIVQVHNRGLIHRDLKPSNIMMSGDRPIIIDFGVSAQSIEARLASAGSPLFMAPEQTDPIPDTSLVDVYAIAGIGYYLLTGNPPNGRDAEEARQYLAFKRTVSPQLLKHCKYRNVIMQALSPHPMNRPQSAGELLNDLECAQVGISSIREHKRDPFHIRTRKPAMLVAELAVISTLSVLLLLNWKHTGTLEDTAKKATIALNATNQQTQRIVDQLMFAQGGEDAAYWILKELAHSPSEEIAEAVAHATAGKSIPMIREEISMLERSPAGETLTLAQKHLTHAKMMERHNRFWAEREEPRPLQFSSFEIRSAYTDAYDYLSLSLNSDEDHAVLDRLNEFIASYPTD
jgi:serine/threonine protein kinase